MIMIITEKAHNTHLEPRQHEFLGRELGLSDLVMHDEWPDKTQDELEVAIDDVHITWKEEKNEDWLGIVVEEEEEEEEE